MANNMTPVGVAATIQGLDSFTSGMNKMQSSMQQAGNAAQQATTPYYKFGYAIGSAGNDLAMFGQKLAAGIATTAIVGSIGLLTSALTGLVTASKMGLDSLIGWGEQLDRLGDQFGMTGEQASVWTVAMNRVGLTVEEGGAGLNFFTKNLDDAKSQMTEMVPAKTDAQLAQLKQRIDDESIALERAQIKMADAEKPTKEMGWAIEDHQKKLARLNDEYAQAASLVPAAEKEIKPFQKALNTLGVDAFDTTGKIRSMDSLMPEIMDKFQAMPAGVNSTALAMDLFGARGGTKFLDFLRQGSTGLKNSQELAKEFGLVMSTEGVNAVEEYGFALNELNLGLTGIKNQIGMAVLPYIRQFVGIIGQSIPSIVGFAKAMGEKLGAGLQVVINLVNAFQAGGFGGLATALGIPPEVQQGISDFVSTLSTLAATVSGVLMTAFTWLNTTGFPLMRQGLDFVIQNWDAFSGALIAIGAVLAGAVIVGSIAAIAGAIASLVTPVGLIIAAVGLLGAAWNTNFLGMRDAITAFWSGTVQPALEQLGAWLAVNLPIAIQALANFWNGVLLPALQATGAFIMGTVVPAFQQVYNWLASNLPGAISTVVNTWNGVLLPAFQAVGNFIAASVLPMFEALGNILSATVGKALEFLGLLIQNIVMPAFSTWFASLQSQGVPVLQQVGDFISSTLSPVLEYLATNILPVIEQVFVKIGAAMATATESLNQFAGMIKSVQPPGWLNPGSPTPFEVGLMGIASALSGKVVKAVQEFAAIAPPAFQALASAVTQIKTDLAEMADTTLTAFSEAMSAAGSAMVSNFEEANSGANELVDSIQELRQALSGIAGYAQTAGSAFNSFGEAGNSIYSVLIPALQSLVSWLNDVANAAEDAAANVAAVGGASEGAGGPGFQAGVRNFTVPPGFPNDTFPVRLTTGEKFSVIPRGATGSNGGTTVAINFGDVAINNGMDLAELGMFVERSVVQALGA